MVRSERDPGYERAPRLAITTTEQLRALSNVTRHRILGLMHDRPYSASQIGRELGMAKGSASYHLKVLEQAGLVTVVSTRKVRGVTERFFGRTATGFEPGTSGAPEGARGLLFRLVAEDVEGSDPRPEELLIVRRLRLDEAALAELRATLADALDRWVDRANPDEPVRTVAVALYTPPMVNNS